MKKLTVLFLMMIYMASAIGVTYSLHYCGSKFKQVCFTSDTEKNCCGDHETKGCCSDKVVSVKCKDNHTPGLQPLLPELFSFIVPVIHFAHPLVKRTAEGYQTFVAADTSPPPIQGIPLYLKIRVIRV